MLSTIATFALGALLAAFAVYAVMLNESEHARRRRRRRGAAPGPVTATEPAAVDPLAAPAMARDGRRLPVGDFLFGALYLQGEEPLPFAELASAASDAGLDIGQALAWLAQAEESGLVERMQQRGTESSPDQPAVRLTEAGMDVARNNRRGAAKPARTTP